MKCEFPNCKYNDLYLWYNSKGEDYPMCSYHLMWCRFTLDGIQLDKYGLVWGSDQNEVYRDEV